MLVTFFLLANISIANKGRPCCVL